jgi:hypothetical protein
LTAPFLCELGKGRLEALGKQLSDAMLLFLALGGMPVQLDLAGVGIDPALGADR